MIAAIVLASGTGARFGGDIPKQFLPLGNRPMFLHSLETFDHHPDIDRLVLACHPDWTQAARGHLRALKKPCEIVPGGATRMESAWNGLQSLPAQTEYVLIHDAARPLVQPDTITALVDAVAVHRAVIAAIATDDTLAEADGNRIVALPDRARFLRVQTPQAFAYSLILDAFKRAWADGFTTTTDDSRIVHRLGHPVAWVEGSERAFKITSPQDLLLAERLLGTGTQ